MARVYKENHCSILIHSIIHALVLSVICATEVIFDLGCDFEQIFVVDT